MHWWNDTKKLSDKWLNRMVQRRFFLWLRVSRLFPIPCSEPSPRQRVIYDVKFQILSQVYILLPKNGIFINSWSHRKLFHFTVRIEVSALLKNRAVLVSFHKQNYVVLSAKWNAQSFVNSWSLRPHLSIFSNGLSLFLSFISSY